MFTHKHVLEKFRSNPVVNQIDLTITYGTEFTFDDEAGKIWDEFYHKVFGEENVLLARAETIVARLALPYSALDCEAVIRKEHLNAAIAVWEYWTRSIDWIFGQSNNIGGY